MLYPMDDDNSITKIDGKNDPVIPDTKSEHLVAFGFEFFDRVGTSKRIFAKFFQNLPYLCRIGSIFEKNFPIFLQIFRRIVDNSKHARNPHAIGIHPFFMRYNSRGFRLFVFW